MQLKTSQILTVLLRFVHSICSLQALTPIALQRRTSTTPAVATPTPPRLLIFMRTRSFFEQARCSSTVSGGHFTEARSSSGRLGDSRYRERVRNTTIGVGDMDLNPFPLSLVETLKSNNNPQMSYQVGFCFWLLTFEEDIAEQINKYVHLPTLAMAFLMSCAGDTMSSPFSSVLLKRLPRKRLCA